LLAGIGVPYLNLAVGAARRDDAIIGGNGEPTDSGSTRANLLEDLAALNVPDD
jgi:hypothetical protein